MPRVSSQAALPSSLASPLVSSDILTTSLLKVFLYELTLLVIQQMTLPKRKGCHTSPLESESV